MVFQAEGSHKQTGQQEVQGVACRESPTEKGTCLLRVRGWWMSHPLTFGVPILSPNPSLSKGAHAVGFKATEKPPPHFTGRKVKAQSTETT